MRINWANLMESRNLTSHSYNEETASEIAEKIQIRNAIQSRTSGRKLELGRSPANPPRLPRFVVATPLGFRDFQSDR